MNEPTCTPAQSTDMSPVFDFAQSFNFATQTRFTEGSIYTRDIIEERKEGKFAAF